MLSPSCLPNKSYCSVAIFSISWFAFLASSELTLIYGILSLLIAL